MKNSIKIIILPFFYAVLCVFAPVSGHNISFCGEQIPVDNDFVANKLMNVIKNQMPYANMPRLRQRALDYFPYIEDCLKRNGIPQDFKYLPIVESGFVDAASLAGARGFWQLMPETAKQFNLIVNSVQDDREDLQKSTEAACKMIVQMYNFIKSRTNSTSWVLTAAAYNFGVGNVTKAINKQGADYFSMNLNPETAEYVYKIIAVKELFENPELYMNNFGTNVFKNSAKPTVPIEKPAGPTTVNKEFSSITVNTAPVKAAKPTITAFVVAKITGKHDKIQDGDLVSVELGNDLDLDAEFIKKGNVVKGTAWLIDDRVYIDMGFGHAVVVYDSQNKKGISVSDFNSEDIFLILKTEKTKF